MGDINQTVVRIQYTIRLTTTTEIVYIGPTPDPVRLTRQLPEIPLLNCGSNATDLPTADGGPISLS